MHLTLTQTVSVNVAIQDIFDILIHVVHVVTARPRLARASRLARAWCKAGTTNCPAASHFICWSTAIVRSSSFARLGCTLPSQAACWIARTSQVIGGCGRCARSILSNTRSLHRWMPKRFWYWPTSGVSHARKVRDAHCQHVPWQQPSSGKTQRAHRVAWQLRVPPPQLSLSLFSALSPRTAIVLPREGHDSALLTRLRE